MRAACQKTKKKNTSNQRRKLKFKQKQKQRYDITAQQRQRHKTAKLPAKGCLQQISILEQFLRELDNFVRSLPTAACLLAADECGQTKQNDKKQKNFFTFSQKFCNTFLYQHIFNKNSYTLSHSVSQRRARTLKT